MSHITDNKNKGISLYLSLIIMTIFLAIVLGMSPILIDQIKMIKGMGDSVKALYAADTGIERALYDLQPSHSGTLSNDSSYEVTTKCSPLYTDCPIASGFSFDPDCTGDYFCIKSAGDYLKIKRAIEVVR